MLEIIPAIDLRGGQAVRLKQGDFAREEKVADDPVAVAREFAAQGAKRIHVVDLDGAKTGTPQNTETISAIIRASGLPVQVGGGVRSVESAERLFEIGANRLIVGTSAARNPELIATMLERFGERLIVGADALNGMIAVHGWQETTGETAADFGRRMVSLGARRLLFTDVGRDGLLQGVNVEATRDLALAVGVPVIASGGVSGPDDISRLAAVQQDGVESVIIGKALYAGRLTLADALRLVAG